MGQEQSLSERILRGISVYGLWLISSGLLFLILMVYMHPIIFVSWFSNLSDVAPADRYEAFTAWRASSQFVIYLFGVIWLGVVIYKEDYFRKFLDSGRSLFGIVRIVLIEACVLGLLYGFQVLIF